MAARIPQVLLLLLIQAVFLQSVEGLATPKRDGQYTMNMNGITWNATCNAPSPGNNLETRRQAVERAWSGALELIDSAWTRFHAETLPKLGNEDLDEDTKHDINAHDPASVLYPSIYHIFGNSD